MASTILTPTEQRIIQALHEHGEQASILALAELVSADYKYVISLVNRLNKRGIISMHAEPGRCKRVRLAVTTLAAML